jgi:hypothetical protein
MSLSSMSTGRDRGGRLPTQIVPTDCLSCQSAGSVRRGVCDNCGARVVEQHLPALRPDQVELEVADVPHVAATDPREHLAVPA